MSESQTYKNSPLDIEHASHEYWNIWNRIMCQQAYKNSYYLIIIKKISPLEHLCFFLNILVGANYKSNIFVLALFSVQ